MPSGFFAHGLHAPDFILCFNPTKEIGCILYSFIAYKISTLDLTLRASSLVSSMVWISAFTLSHSALAAGTGKVKALINSSYSSDIPLIITEIK